MIGKIFSKVIVTLVTGLIVAWVQNFFHIRQTLADFSASVPESRAIQRIEPLRAVQKTFTSPARHASAPSEPLLSTRGAGVSANLPTVSPAPLNQADPQTIALPAPAAVADPASSLQQPEPVISPVPQSDPLRGAVAVTPGSTTPIAALPFNAAQPSAAVGMVVSAAGNYAAFGYPGAAGTQRAWASPRYRTNNAPAVFPYAKNPQAIQQRPPFQRSFVQPRPAAAARPAPPRPTPVANLVVRRSR